MPTSEARIRANQQNAAKSTGPRTVEGKEKSRQNALKHGLTGAGVVLLEADAAELTRRTAQFSEELVPIGEVGERLVARVALHSLRMDRAVDQQNVALAVRLRQVEADFVAPQGVDENEARKLLDEQLRIARFDPGKEACLARSYEAASERAFYRGLKQLRQMEIQADELIKADDAKNHQEEMNQAMASFFQKQAEFRQEDEEFDAMYESMKMDLPPRPANSPRIPSSSRLVDVPMTIGRPG
jgi:hypothetical protein